MRNTLLLLLLVMNVERASGMDHDRTMILSWELLKDAGYGLNSKKEHAAFLVEDEHGELQLSRWPWGAESMRASFNGEVPRGALAIVHTHPNDLPNPSPGDVALAKKLGMAVYVITRSSVTRTDGSNTSQVARGDWKPSR